MSIENYDLKVAQAELGTVIVNVITAAVPAGMKRYVTYIKYCNTHTTAQEIELYDSDTTGGGGVDTVLDVQKLAAGDTIMFPDTPDPDKPIMPVAAEHFLTSKTNVDVAEITVGYYDK